MKKKIINGILMVALLFAATTSFVSCKDNVDDELVAVYAQLAKQKADLQQQINQYQSQIDAIKANDALQDAAIDDLQDQVDDLQDQLDDINEQIAEQSAAIDEIQGELDEVEDAVATLGDAIELLQNEIEEIAEAVDEINRTITGIKINQTISNVTGTINLPGGMMNLNALAAFYGENVMGITEFPTSKFADNHIYSDNQLTADEVAPAAGQQYTFNTEGYITEKHNNAGMLFFTVQALDQDNFDISEYTLTAQNSQGRITPITFSDVKPSSYLIQPGVFKSAYVDSDPDLNGDPTFFQARAHIDEKDLEASKFDVNKFFNLKEFVNSDFKNMVDEIKAAEGTTNKAKAVVKVVARTLVKIYSGNMSGDNKQTYNPSWSDHKLVLSKEVDGITVSKTALDYDLAVSAVQPLSYNSFWAFENGVKRIDLDLVESAIAKFAKVVKSALPGASSTSFPQIKNLSADGLTAYVWATEDGSNPTDPSVGAWVELPEQIIEAINNGLKIDDLNEALQDVSQKADLGATVDNLEARFNSYVEAFGNKVVAALNNHRLTRAITPLVLYKNTNGINRLITGLTVTPGIMQINITSPTEELICPAYAKYVAVFKDGSATEAYVAPGSTQRFDLNLTQPGSYKIVVSCIDYFGYIVNKRFEVTVE